MAQQRRMIYGSIYANAELNQLPIQARHLYIGTLVMADDDGRLRADPRFLKGQFFAYDEDISSKDVGNWVRFLTQTGLMHTYEADGVQVLQHPKWKEYQRIRQDMYVESKLPPPLHGRNGSVTVPVHNINQDKVKKGKEGDKSPPNPIFERKMREKDEEYRGMVKDLAEKDYLTPERIHRIATEEFLPYWLERSENGKKARWEKERVFDYQRRFRTWLKKHHEIAKDVRCKSDRWHRQGESCYCVKEEKVVRKEPSAAVKELAARMRI